MAVPGRFAMIRRLAVGGMSEVFLVRADGAPADEVPHLVLKRLLPHLATHPGVLRMFAHEARLLGRLSHPAIPRVHHASLNAPPPWFVMERLAGRDLASLCARPGGMTRAAAVDATMQLLDALAYVHAATDERGRAMRAVHRDVAPANVLVRTDGTLGLIDFGIATSVERSNDAEGAMRGTPGYLAPESVTAASEGDHRVDIWGAGVVLYECVLGRKLFTGNPLAMMNAIADGVFPRPREVDPKLPEPIERVILKALARDPDSRFADARAMADTLRVAASASGCAPSRSDLARAATG